MKLDLNKYKIERRYINKRPKVRPGTRLTSGTPGFFVAHDTGNAGADADAHYRYFNTQTERSASAQTFIDDKTILEIIPTGTGSDPAERAYHVLYNVQTDNDRFGDDANDIALGIELCYGGKINFDEAYKRFVWYLAYCCYKFNKNPLIYIASHKQLDPARKFDCDQALAKGGKTLKDLIYDVAAEMKLTPAQVVPKALTALPSDIAQSIIDNYVTVAWGASTAAGDKEGADHFHRLANNLRMAAGIPLEAGKAALPPQKLPKSNAQEIIFRWLSSAWFKSRAAGDQMAMTHFNNLANYLRKAAGIPAE
ncbi:peptidoglycan recognition protein family protein [Paenibacillus sp. SN-8-1]|uniref:peptidoglycan recognition protein family protein n=1 Tax=Paenibacillus sp. SN-8-1 TaxID=3435409 RepID=UPI003D9A84DE